MKTGLLFALATTLLFVSVDANAFTNLTAQATLGADNSETGDAFGKSVGISGDTVIVGAYL